MLKNYSLNLLLLLFLTGCASNKPILDNKSTLADKIFTNGKFYTVDTNQPWVEAVAIKDGKYLYVGNTEKALYFHGNNTQVINLENKMVMPGINDAHLHTTKGGIRRLYTCQHRRINSGDL